MNPQPRMAQPAALALAATFLAAALFGCAGSPTSSPPSQTAASPSPKQLFPDDFAQVCNGAGLADAAAYDKTAKTTHPILAFERPEATAAFHEAYKADLPQGWKLDWQQVKNTQLVVCLTATKRQLVEKCEFEADENDNKTRYVEIYNTTYEAKLFEAKTGKPIEQTSFDLKSEECPQFHMFDADKETETEDANYAQALLEFVKPHVQP